MLFNGKVIFGLALLLMITLGLIKSLLNIVNKKANKKRINFSEKKLIFYFLEKPLPIGLYIFMIGLSLFKDSFNNQVLAIFLNFIFSSVIAILILLWNKNRLEVFVEGIKIYEVFQTITDVLSENKIDFTNIELPEDWRRKVKINNSKSFITLKDLSFELKEITITFVRYKQIPLFNKVLIDISDEINSKSREINYKRKTIFALVGYGIALLLVWFLFFIKI